MCNLTLGTEGYTYISIQYDQGVYKQLKANTLCHIII